MKNRNNNKVICLIAAVLVFGGVLNIAAQSDGWRVLSSTKDASGKVTVVSVANDRRQMITTMHYFRDRPDHVQSEHNLIRDPNGTKLSLSYSFWDYDGRNVQAGKESYNSSEATIAGARWYYENENGRYIGPRIDEIFNPRTRKWERTPSVPNASSSGSNSGPTPGNTPPPTNSGPGAGQGGPGNSPSGGGSPTGNANAPAPVVPPTGTAPQDPLLAAIQGAYKKVKALADEARSDARKRSLAGTELQNFIEYAASQAAKEEAKAAPNTDRVNQLYDLVGKAQDDLEALNNPPAEPVPAPVDSPTVSSSPLAETWSAQMKAGETSKVCPANPRRELGALQTVSYGSGKYFVTSPVCLAAVHANKITFERGGTVTWRMADITWPDAQAAIASPAEPRNGVDAAKLPGTCGKCALQFIN